MEEKKNLDYATKLDLEKSDHRINTRISDEVRKINEKMTENREETNTRLGKLESSLDLNNRETRTLNSSVRDLNGSVKELSTIVRQRDIDVIKLQHRMDVSEDTLGRKGKKNHRKRRAYRRRSTNHLYREKGRCITSVRHKNATNRINRSRLRLYRKKFNQRTY